MPMKLVRREVNKTTPPINANEDGQEGKITIFFLLIIPMRLVRRES
jgi:hypothetical protein